MEFYCLFSRVSNFHSPNDIISVALSDVRTRTASFWPSSHRFTLILAHIHSILAGIWLAQSSEIIISFFQAHRNFAAIIRWHKRNIKITFEHLPPTHELQLDNAVIWRTFEGYLWGIFGGMSKHHFVLGQDTAENEWNWPKNQILVQTNISLSANLLKRLIVDCLLFGRQKIEAPTSTQNKLNFLSSVHSTFNICVDDMLSFDVPCRNHSSSLESVCKEKRDFWILLEHFQLFTFHIFSRTLRNFRPDKHRREPISRQHFSNLSVQNQCDHFPETMSTLHMFEIIGCHSTG